MKNLKPHQKSQLIYEFGILMQPLEELASAEEPSTVDEYRIAIAKIRAGDGAWRELVREFATFAPDIFFHPEYNVISHVPDRCLGTVHSAINDPDLQNDPNHLRWSIEQEVANAKRKFFEYIERIPFEWEPVIFEANTPFTAYLRIKESFVSAKQRLHYFDRYLKPDFFTLFLDLVERTVSVRLVTTPGDARYGVASVAAVSNLAGQEFADYKLIEVALRDIHDRNLRVDDLIFSLGPGVDAAGMALTNFGPTDNSPEAHEELDQIIANGRVVQ